MHYAFNKENSVIKLKRIELYVFLFYLMSISIINIYYFHVLKLSITIVFLYFNQITIANSCLF